MQHVLIEYELDPEVVEELASGRTGGWLGRKRAHRGPLGWRSLVRPVWPLILLVLVAVAGVRAVTVIPASMWMPLLFDFLRLSAVALPIAFALALALRRSRRVR